MPSSAQASQPSPHTLVFIIGMTVLWLVLGLHMALSMGRHSDFLCYYAGGSALLHGQGPHLYELAAQLATQRSFFSALPNVIPFIRPPFYAAFLAFFALLPLTESFAIWVALQIVVLVVCVLWFWRRWGPTALIFSAIFLPAPLGIASGQDCAFMLAIVVGVFLLQEKKLDWASGAILGLGLIKFQLFVVWPLALLFQKRWRIIFGATIVVAVEVLISLLLVGRSGIASYAHLLRNGNVNSSPELMINVYSLTWNFGARNLVISATLIAAVLLMSGVLSWRSSFWNCLAAACIGSILISPHSYGYDVTFLLPSLLFVLFHSKSALARFLAVFLCSPVPYLMNLVGSPWSATSSAALLALLALLAWEKRRFEKPYNKTDAPLAAAAA